MSSAYDQHTFSCVGQPIAARFSLEAVFFQPLLPMMAIGKVVLPMSYFTIDTRPRPRYIKNQVIRFLEQQIIQGNYDFRFLITLTYENPHLEIQKASRDHNHIKRVILRFLINKILERNSRLPRFFFFSERNRNREIHTHLLMEYWGNDTSIPPKDPFEIPIHTRYQKQIPDDDVLYEIRNQLHKRVHRIQKSTQGINIKDVWNEGGIIWYLNKDYDNIFTEGIDYIDLENSDFIGSRKERTHTKDTETYPLQEIANPSMPSKSIDPSRFNRNKGKKRKGFRHRRKHRRGSSTQDYLIFKRLPEGETV